MSVTYIEPTQLANPGSWVGLMEKIPGRLLYSGVTLWTPYTHKKNRYLLVPVQGERDQAIDFLTGGPLTNLNPVDVVHIETAPQFCNGVYMIARYGDEEVYDYLGEAAAMDLINHLKLSTVPFMPLRNKAIRTTLPKGKKK